MSDAVPALFADITAMLEDMHTVAIEGQSNDNSPDMQCALMCQLRIGITSLNGLLGNVRKRLDFACD
ncbi:hypothetical protein [Aurantiacibacter spongiae]|uniref:Uncharacterized protein n=1 Tax=Aurantiacibacter spongiae TaxID=2488860 RepID=A0A3N5CPN2_9SPHN|nr:hypothetical protein [Aurantiacibacter spongiae]RPF70963.1 hypothetical protein EG799_04520 [Aurantiacibacter spongiae]